MQTVFRADNRQTGMQSENVFSSNGFLFKWFQLFELIAIKRRKGKKRESYKNVKLLSPFHSPQPLFPSLPAQVLAEKKVLFSWNLTAAS